MYRKQKKVYGARYLDRHHEMEREYAQYLSKPDDPSRRNPSWHGVLPTRTIPFDPTAHSRSLASTAVGQLPATVEYCHGVQFLEQHPGSGGVRTELNLRRTELSR